MRLKTAILTGLTAVSLVPAMAGQAQAFNLLVAAGNPTIRVVTAADGTRGIVTVSKPGQTATVIEGIKPATG
jgi:hypothetical protein